MSISRLGLGVLAGAFLAGSACAQTVYNGSAGFSQDSILAGAQAAYAQAAQHEIETAETNLNIAVNAQGFQYKENLTPGDRESGGMPGFTIGASYLQPVLAWSPRDDLYTAFSYQFNAGNLAYDGTVENLNTGATAPFDTTDRAVMNRIEGRFGFGFPVTPGWEVIPYLAAGYQSWNRNTDTSTVGYGDEDYSGALLGLGLRNDWAVTPTLVVRAEAEILGILVANITNNDAYISHGMGGSAEERLSTGLDYNISGPLHFTFDTYWEHFNWAGFKATPATYGAYEPLSTTYEAGVNVGTTYAF
jgi:hypothetical protein